MGIATVHSDISEADDDGAETFRLHRPKADTIEADENFSGNKVPYSGNILGFRLPMAGAADFLEQCLGFTLDEFEPALSFSRVAVAARKVATALRQDNV